MIDEIAKKLPAKLVMKVCAILAGVTNCFLGFALYFMLVEKDKEKAEWFGNGALVGLIITILGLIFGVLFGIFGLFTLIFG